MGIYKKRFLVFLFLALGIFLIFNLSKNIWSLWQREERLREARKRLEILKRKNVELKRKLELVQEPEFVEREAREKLNLAKPEETIVILPPITLSESTPQAVPLPNWKRWWRLFF